MGMAEFKWGDYATTSSTTPPWLPPGFLGGPITSGDTFTWQSTEWVGPPSEKAGPPAESKPYIRAAPSSPGVGYTYRLTEEQLASRIAVEGCSFLEMNGEWRDAGKYQYLVKRLMLRATKGHWQPWFTIRGDGFRLDDPNLFDGEE